MADNPILDRVSGFAAQPVTRQLSLLVGFAASIVLAVGLLIGLHPPLTSQFMDR